MKSFLKVGAFVLVLGAVIALLDVTVTFFFHKDLGLLRHSGVGHVTFYVLFVLNVLLFQTYVNRKSFSSLGLERYPGWPMTVFKGWIVGGVAFVAYTWIMDAAGVVDLRLRYDVGQIVLALVIGSSAFAIATTEEILFRGFFLQTMLEDLPKWLAIGLTGVIFVFFHKLGRIQDFLTVPYDMMLAGGIFCLNILLCISYLKSKTLYLPIGIHSGLVFAKVAFRKLKLIEVVEPNSFWFGLEGDARRGFLAWILFLSGILVLKFLITDRERKAFAHKRA